MVGTQNAREGRRPDCPDCGASWKVRQLRAHVRHCERWEERPRLVRHLAEQHRAA